MVIGVPTKIRSAGIARAQVPTNVKVDGGLLSSLLTSHPKAHTCSIGPVVECDVIGMPQETQKCDEGWTLRRQCGQWSTGSSDGFDMILSLERV